VGTGLLGSRLNDTLSCLVWQQQVLEKLSEQLPPSDFSPGLAVVPCARSVVALQCRAGVLKTFVGNNCVPT
jgi:hypothetical protein